MKFVRVIEGEIERNEREKRERDWLLLLRFELILQEDSSCDGSVQCMPTAGRRSTRRLCIVLKDPRQGVLS